MRATRQAGVCGRDPCPNGKPRLSTFAEGLAEPVSGVAAKDRVIVLEPQFGKLFGAQKGGAPAPFRVLAMDTARAL